MLVYRGAEPVLKDKWNAMNFEGQSRTERCIPTIVPICKPGTF